MRGLKNIPPPFDFSFLGRGEPRWGGISKCAELSEFFSGKRR